MKHNVLTVNKSVHVHGNSKHWSNKPSIAYLAKSKIDFNYSVCLTCTTSSSSIILLGLCTLITLNSKKNKLLTFTDWQLKRKGFWDWNRYKYKYKKIITIDRINQIDHRINRIFQSFLWLIRWVFDCFSIAIWLLSTAIWLLSTDIQLHLI